MVWEPHFEKSNDKKFVPDQLFIPFRDLRNKLFDETRDQAASSSDGSLRKYATSDGQLENNQFMYSLAQCTPDLSEDECRNCINAVREKLHNTSVGGAVYKPTCNIRYELNSGPFYTSAVSLAPSPPPDGDNNINIVVIIIVSIGALFVILVVIYILIRLRKNNIRKRKMERQTMEGMSTLESLQYDFDAVKAATDNFSANNKLG